MDLKSGLGFGFFNRQKSKTRKRSERQLADMYNKVAIRGSIQHVWGDELPRDGHVDAIRPQGVTSEKSEYLAPPLLPIDHQADTTLLPSVAEAAAASAASVEGQRHEQRLIETSSTPPPLQPVSRNISSTTSSPPSVRRASLESRTIHKKFSFCPSTISLVSPRSPSALASHNNNNNNPRGPRQSSLTINNGGSNWPYAQSHQSSSTPSFSHAAAATPPLLSSASIRDYQSDDHVSIAADDEDGLESRPLSPSSSLHYSTSILSTSAADPKLDEHCSSFLPGQIYAPALPDALRTLGSLPSHYDEEDEEEDDDDDDEALSIAGLSEVNAGYLSDSDFHSCDDDGDDDNDNQKTHHETDRKRSMKRVSYTKLESGEYLATVTHRKRPLSSSSTSGDASVLVRNGSSGSQWSIEHEFLASGI